MAHHDDIIMMTHVASLDVRVLDISTRAGRRLPPPVSWKFLFQTPSLPTQSAGPIQCRHCPFPHTVSLSPAMLIRNS